MEGKLVFYMFQQSVLQRFIVITENNINHKLPRTAEPYLHISEKTFVAVNIIKGYPFFHGPSFNFFSDLIGGFILKPTGIYIHDFIENIPGHEIRPHSERQKSPDLPVPPSSRYRRLEKVYSSLFR